MVDMLSISKEENKTNYVTFFNKEDVVSILFRVLLNSLCLLLPKCSQSLFLKNALFYFLSC